MTEYALAPEWGLTTDELLDKFLTVIAEKDMELYDHQEEAILEIFSGKNVILNTHTGSGKSLVATAMHYYSVIATKKVCLHQSHQSFSQ